MDHGKAVSMRRAAGWLTLVALVAAVFAAALGGPALARPDDSPAATILRLRDTGAGAQASWTSSCPADVEVVEEAMVCEQTEVLAGRESKDASTVIVFQSTTLWQPGAEPEPLSLRYFSGSSAGTVDRKLTGLHVAGLLEGRACVPGEWDEDWGQTWDCEDAEADVDVTWTGDGELERGVTNSTGAPYPGARFVAHVRGAYRPATATGTIDGQVIAGTAGSGAMFAEALHLLQVCRGGDWPDRDECRSAN